MLPLNSPPRGMALVMAMIVVVLITLLVAGAISFTGTELASAEIQSQEDSMSACIQAARNLFLSRMKVIPSDSVRQVSFDETLEDGGIELRTGHYSTSPALLHYYDVTPSMQDPNINKDTIDNTVGLSGSTKFYIVTTLCRESNDPSSPEREIEFMVRVGL